MVSLTGFKQRFISNWLIVALAISAVALCSRLGFWQLKRAHEKTALINQEKKFSASVPRSWHPAQELPLAYEPVNVVGKYLPAVLLLDNQHHQHRFGYHVLSPFVLNNKHIVLIDRGWVAGDLTRKNLPEVVTPKEEIKLSGQVYYPSAKKIVLGELIEKKQEGLAIIEAIDAQAISQFLQKSVYPFIIRLDKHAAHGYVREWIVVSMPPERHYAYAVQWFGLALALFFLFVVRNIRTMVFP
ncbi:SURF1 family protein [Legionella septentrionalis]|uniref:SURF1 family protein n=1 Tax=Legionella septentrionalis TaxID=2498109 RepID=UPI000F8D6B04|nr:SURF1 family protein [Legionella septentrionalis]RUR17025.1 SURF1 family protein [Legionella septentrionalis]